MTTLIFCSDQARHEPGGGEHVRGHARHPRPHPGQGHHRHTSLRQLGDVVLECRLWLLSSLVATSVWKSRNFKFQLF